MASSNPAKPAAAAPAPVAAPLGAGKAAAPASLHDVAHQVRLVREALQSEKRRLGVFFGAGCPLGIYDIEGKASLKHIPDVSGLTAAVAHTLEADAECKSYWAKLVAACKTASCPSPNVEHVLTQLRTIRAVRGNAPIDGMTSEGLSRLDAEVCKQIVKIVGKALPSHTTSYHRFAAWIGQLTRIHQVELFTPNYDLLMEEALEHYGVPFFDGFVGSREPFFDLAAMEQDVIPPRWTRLWKLHGSINWIKRSDESVYRCYPASDGQVLIYPSHLKYDQSRRMPYLAMIDRLRAFLRETNPVIVVCGYSFTDEHLNEVLLDGLRGNRSAHCFALMYADLKSYGEAVWHASKHSNLTLLAADGAVIATRVGTYHKIDDSAVTPGSGLDREKPTGGASPSDPSPARCCLGDFHYLTLFLETQFGVKTANDSGKETE